MEDFSDISTEEREALGFGVSFFTFVKMQFSGFQNMTDEVAIVTKAKENIIFAMSALSEEQRLVESKLICFKLLCLEDSDVPSKT